MTAAQRRRAITFILVTLTLDAMGIGLILPVMPDLIREVEGGTLGTAALWGGILATTFAVMQFIFGPVLGSLSDRYGRRSVLLISLLVMTVDYLVMAVAGSIWLLFVTRVVGGITAATQSTAAAFIADISKPEEKSANFGLIGAAFGVGFVLGPVIGGLLGEWGTRAPFYAAAALGALNLVFGYFVLPETVTDSIRRPFLWRRANPFGAFRALGQLDGVRRLIFLVFLYEFAFIVYPATWAYFTKEAFGWSPGMVGASLALFGIGIAIVQGALIRPALKRFGERGTIIYGIAFNFAAFVLLTVITTGWVALAFIPVTALGAVVTPALQGLMSQRAGDDQQGELQGVIASAKSIAMIFSPLVMTQLFWMFTNDTGLYFPGAAFALSAAIMIVCMITFLGRPRAA
ncbi:TCR/Tet family MFS transporter [Pseudooctadecabacter sp.]|uniref:TCR/Tet family MFS transporter n=1 Tax=Pseudooctadecabacter sp. TaxID=1966338 RepID=UPI0025EEA4AF|nr:TCR/Tet family MFS transporter [Pseudooctadecabacter sp.]